MRILVVDDNRSSADTLGRVLSKRGDDVTCLYDGAPAIAHLEAHPTDLVITDLEMVPISGMDVLRAARALRPPPEVIVLTARADPTLVAQAMQLGARDLLTKPLTIEQVFARVDAVRAPDAATTDDRDPLRAPGSAAGRALLLTLEKLAAVPSPVWIEGEIGSGRSHAAWMLHRLGTPDLPLTFVDPSHPFPWPERGTVVLSGVDDLPDDLQRDLTRRLPTIPQGVRVVATARPSAREPADRGRRRPDLYYKLAVFTVRVPPLRERVEDIVPLFRDALARFAKRYQRALPHLSRDEVRRLEAHPWPGNVRELFNAAERYVVLGTLAIADPTPVVTEGSTAARVFGPGFSLIDYIDEVERRLLR